jgi:hypothetical protein
MIPSEIEPPRIGTPVIKDLLILSSITIVLKNKTIVSPKNMNHSFFENEKIADLSSFFDGNFKLRIRLYGFSIKEK